MNSVMRRAGILAFVAGVVFSSLPVHAADLKFGVNAPRGPLEAKQRWEPLIAEFSAAVGKSIELVPLAPDQIDGAVADGKVDFALANPVSAVIVAERNKAKPLATLKANGMATFSGVIIAKNGGSISSLNDLKGKKVMAYQFGVSAGAYVFQAYHVTQAGIDPKKDFAAFTEAKKQDDIVLAVKAGIIDAGFVRTGVLESMAKEGKVKMEDFVVIDKKQDEFPQVHSTALYPEWILVAGASTDAGVADSVKAAALKVDSGSAGAKSAKIDGFVDSVDLAGLQQALKVLKLAPYDK